MIAGIRSLEKGIAGGPRPDDPQGDMGSGGNPHGRGFSPDRQILPRKIGTLRRVVRQRVQ